MNITSISVLANFPLKTGEVLRIRQSEGRPDIRVTVGQKIAGDDENSNRKFAASTARPIK